MNSTPEAVRTPPDEAAAFVIDAASWAPSVHNTQPWWFALDGSRLTVHADVDRRLGVADPDGREMLISCGAALFTVRLAARHRSHRGGFGPDRPPTGLLSKLGLEASGPAPHRAS